MLQCLDLCTVVAKLYLCLCACRSCSRVRNATVTLSAASVKQPESPAAMLVLALHRVSFEGLLPTYIAALCLSPWPASNFRFRSQLSQLIFAQLYRRKSF